MTNGRGRAGFFQITNTANTQPALQAQTNGQGFAVQGLATGIAGGAVEGRVTGTRGTAGRFEVDNATNPDDGLNVVINGTGRGGFFESQNPNNPNPALTVSTNGTRGGAGLFEVSNPDNNTRNALEVRTNGLEGTAISAVSTGLGSKVGLFRNIGSGDGLTVAAPRIALRVEGRSQLSGDVSVSGTLTKSASSFKIDHPLDPEHKYLSHSFIESPDMMNVYNGNVTLDASGRATVALPAYFEALNREFRYQLTAIGAPGPNLYIAEGVKQNRFQIAGGRAYAHVSWQVTGVRQDAYAEQHRIRVEEEKPRGERALVARR